MWNFIIVEIFSSGIYEYDKSLAIIHFKDVIRLANSNGPSGLKIKTNKVINALSITREAMTSITDHLQY